jgi:MFS family permease
MLAMPGSVQFLGWMVASMFVPRLGDLYGRKLPFIISVLAASFLYVGIFLTSNLNVIILIFFFKGMTQAGKYSLAHVYIQELMPNRYKSISGLLMQFADSLTLVYVAFYNRWVSKSWVGF